MAQQNNTGGTTFGAVHVVWDSITRHNTLLPLLCFYHTKIFSGDHMGQICARGNLPSGNCTSSRTGRHHAKIPSLPCSEQSTSRGHSDCVYQGFVIRDMYLVRSNTYAMWKKQCCFQAMGIYIVDLAQSSVLKETITHSLLHQVCLPPYHKQVNSRNLKTSKRKKVNLQRYFPKTFQQFRFLSLLETDYLPLYSTSHDGFFFHKLY